MNEKYARDSCRGFFYIFERFAISFNFPSLSQNFLSKGNFLQNGSTGNYVNLAEPALPLRNTLFKNLEKLSTLQDGDLSTATEKHQFIFESVCIQVIYLN